LFAPGLPDDGFFEVSNGRVYILFHRWLDQSGYSVFKEAQLLSGVDMRAVGSSVIAVSAKG
jgi:hypothetical protein